MKKKIVFVLVFFHIIISLISIAQEKDESQYYYENAVYKEEIKSVQLFRDGFELSNPVIELNGDVQLVLKFDDLSGSVKNYAYTIIHCDADWNESFIMQSEYIDGFPNNPINDYASSFNTTVDYVNYRLMIPNEDVKLNYSGNYVVVVFEDNDLENIVLIKRFHVLEPLVDVEGRVKNATFDPFKGDNQEVDFKINTSKIDVQSPSDDIKVVITQNRRWDNAIRGLKPLYVNGDVLDYDYNKENVFPAGNEFRYFDVRTNKYVGENVASIDFHRPYYHATLMVDELRANKKYFSYREMNGNFVVESQDRVDDFDTECDYVFVHFTLPLPTPLVGGSVNVFGALTDWNANKSNQMTWNPVKAAYELSLMLKQGYYNYQYAYVPAGSTFADLTNIEGSHVETENEYQIFVYYKGMGMRYDRLIGFYQISSEN